MKASEVLKVLNEEISEARQAGVTQVSLDSLEALVSDLSQTASSSPDGVAAGDAAMEAYKAQWALHGSSLQQVHESNLEMLRATITAAQSALKSAVLINGGAAVAVLAFISNAWGKPGTESVLPGLAYGLSLFVWGVLSAACATGATYFSQAGFGQEFGRHSQAIGLVSRGLAILSGVGSYVLFGCAAWQTYVSIAG